MTQESTRNGLNKSIDDIQDYWREKNIPQQWYSDKLRLSLQWYNELARKRYEVYYEYLLKDGEFEYHAGERVLEVGVGIGTDLAQYAKNGAKVSGIDLGQDQVDLTKVNFELRKLQYDELKQASAEDLPFDDGSFDLVYSFGVLHHTPDTAKAISEVKRVLAEDGQAIIMLYARGWKHYLKRCLIHGLFLGKYFRYGSWQAVYNDISEVNGGSPKTGVYTKREIKKMFSDFGEVEIEKRRLGEFIDYRPYRSRRFPFLIRNFLDLLNVQSLIGENWLIKAYKKPAPKPKSVFDVIFKHY
jgi:SAM-dependent methyltransferase